MLPTSKLANCPDGVYCKMNGYNDKDLPSNAHGLGTYRNYVTNLSDKDAERVICERGGWYNEETKEGEYLGTHSALFANPLDYGGKPYAGAARACYVTYTGKYKD